MKTKNNILIVEDNKAIIQLLSKKIEADESLAVLAALDGQEALEILEKGTVDLVLLDIDLPIMSGLMVAEKMKENEVWKNIPIIVISNSGSPQDIARLAKMGIEDYFIKAELDPVQIVKKVKERLEYRKNSLNPSKRDIANNDTTKKEVTQVQKEEKILVVEDDKFLLELVVKKLTEHGFNVIIAIDGEDALGSLEREENISLVLLDLMLPEIDGFEVLEKIRANPKYKDLPVIVLSNLGQEAEVHRAFNLGATDYMIKVQFTTEDIVKKVKEQLLKRQKNQ